MKRIYSKPLILVLLLLLMSRHAWAVGNEPFNIDPATGVLPSVPWNKNAPALMRTWMQQEIPAVLGRYFPNDWVNSGGSHPTSGTCVSSAFATEAFTSPTSPGGRSDHVQAKSDGSGGTAAIDYSLVNANCSNPGSATARVAICSIAGNTTGNWNRSSGSNYFVNVLDASPAIPAGCAGLMDVVITNGAIASVVVISNPAPILTSIVLPGPFLPSSTIGGLPTAGTVGRMRRLTNDIFPSALVLDNGVDWQNIAPRIFNNTDYNFHARAPGGSLAVGANTITVVPCPFGVAGTDSAHYLRVSGGVGTAEQVLITGGTCTSGAATGTLVFTAANTHSGAWTIASATAGIQEAVNMATVPTFGAVHIPAGVHPVYAKITIPGPTAIFGDGPSTYIGTAFASGDTFYFPVDASLGISSIANLSIHAYGVSKSSGAEIRMSNSGYVSNVTIVGAWVGIQLDDAVSPVVNGVYLLAGQQYGIYVLRNTPGSSALQLSNSIITMQAIAGAIGLYINAANGLITSVYATNLTFQGGDFNILSDVANNANAAFSESIFTGILFDSAAVAEVQLRNSNTLTQRAVGITFNGIRGSGLTNAAIFDIDRYIDVHIIGCDCFTTTNGAIAGIILRGVHESSIQNSYIGASGPQIYLLTSGADVSQNIKIQDNFLGYYEGGAPIGTYGVLAANATDTKITIQNNSIGSTIPVSLATVTDVIVQGNLGLSNTVPAVPSGATVTFPMLDDGQIMTLTGNTAVSAVAGLRLGQRGILIATDVAPGAWTAGATIGNTFTPVQNVPLQWVFDGTKIYGK